MARPRAKRATMWSAEGYPWTYRKPYLAGGKWRARRRNRFTGQVEQVTLLSESITDAKNELQEMAANERQVHDNGEEHAAPEPKSATVAEVFGKWAETCDVRERTLEEYRRDAKMFAKLLDEQRLMAEVTFPDIEQLFSVEWRERSGRTKIHHRGLLCRIFGWAVKHGYAKKNVAEGIDIQKSWSREASLAAQTTGQALSVKEARKLLVACRRPVVVHFEYKNREPAEQELKPPAHLFLFVFLALRTGLRESNLIPTSGKPGLLWKHVDLENRILEIPGDLMKNQLPLTVPLHAEAIAELKNVRKALGCIPKPEDPIIGEVAELRKSFRSALKRAKLGDRGFRIHDLRHTFVAWLGEHAPHAVLQRLAGHSARTVTDKYAKHQDVKTMRKYLDKLACLLTVPGSKPTAAKAAGA